MPGTITVNAAAQRAVSSGGQVIAAHAKAAVACLRMSSKSIVVAASFKFRNAWFVLAKQMSTAGSVWRHVRGPIAALIDPTRGICWTPTAALRTPWSVEALPLE